MKQTLNEQLSRIKSMIGLITEQSEIIVSIRGEQPYSSATDWDAVHGILGSKRIDDDLEQRVGEKLKQGSYSVVDVEVSSYVQGNKIITDAKVTLEVNNNNPDIAFTTRGSIGSDYEARHNGQINGLKDRLSQYYKGSARQLITMVVGVKGTDVRYKQSFFAVSKNPQTNTQQTNTPQQEQSVIIKGTDFADLRAKISALTKNISIDVSSIKIDAPNFSVSYKPGSEQIKTMSFVFDDRGDLEKRFVDIQAKNPTIEKIENGTIQNIQWALSIIR
jgi:hypothetical protein